MGLERLVVQTEQEMSAQPNNFFSLLPADSPVAPSSNNASLQQILLNTSGDYRPISR